jgi:hypothetical protein
MPWEIAMGLCAPGILTMNEINELEKEQKKEAWQQKARKCSISYDMKHQWIPISSSKSDKSEHVKTIMCTQCWHEVNISDAFEHRTKL